VEYKSGLVAEAEAGQNRSETNSVDLLDAASARILPWFRRW